MIIKLGLNEKCGDKENSRLFHIKMSEINSKWHKTYNFTIPKDNLFTISTSLIPSTITSVNNLIVDIYIFYLQISNVIMFIRDVKVNLTLQT